mgnify:CR=1 FL=1
MLNWEEIVQKYITKHSNLIRKTTQPLRDHFGIGYFTYHRIDRAGNYTVLVDRPEWSEHYVSEKIFLNDPYLRNYDVYQSGMCLVQTNGSQKYKKTVTRAGKKILKMDSAVLLIQKKPEYVEFFGFAGNDTGSVEKIYMNDPHILASFANYFKQQTKAILTNMEQESLSLKILKGRDFLCSTPINTKVSNSSLLSYLTDLGMKSLIQQAQKLSVREQQCLRLLIQDKSSKETAAILGLSSRTVESYFENIKNKLSCWNKQQVLTLAKSLDQIGLLP